MTGMATMPGGLGSIGSFAGTWLVMMVAMMLPSATPVVLGFAQWAEGRHRWLTATGLLGATYLSIWLAFGVACYFIYSALRMPWPNQAVIAGGAVVLAALYALTPIKRSNEQRCRQLCALHGPLPFNPLRSALVVGGKYGLSCIGCSAALMVAMVMIGMSNLIWMVALAAIVLLYKLAPAPGKSRLLLLSAVLAALGIAYPLLG
jgi:predicted metal-binding membrane protein